MGRAEARVDHVGGDARAVGLVGVAAVEGEPRLVDPVEAPGRAALSPL